jgi:PPOX class probable F420-dependent enzyme
MSPYPDSHLDLLEQGRIGMLATNGAGGRPQVTALWFLYEDGEVKISLNENRQKTKNLVADPKVTLLLADLVNPYRTLEIRADAVVEPDPDRAFAKKVGAKYDADLQQMDKPGEQRVVVTLRPVKVNTNG